MEIIDKYKKLISEKTSFKIDAIKIYFKRPLQDNWIEVTDKYAKEYEKPGDDWGLGEYKVSTEVGIISTWRLYQMPHCCAYMVSCNVNIAPSYRSKGLGTILNLLRIEIGKLKGFSAIICTDIEQNTCQRQILAKNGWKDVHSIKNKRTENRVYLSIIDL